MKTPKHTALRRFDEIVCIRGSLIYKSHLCLILTNTQTQTITCEANGWHHVTRIIRKGCDASMPIRKNNGFCMCVKQHDNVG